MSNYKYTSDGKKVVVLGMLNNVESIVQEIFVTAAGDEIPSGEKFTTKSLHDAPVISYKMKTEKELDAKIAKQEAELELMRKQERALRSKRDAQEAITRGSNLALKMLPDADLNSLNLFLTGKANWLVFKSYQITAPRSFSEAITEKDSDYDRFQGLKFLTMYGSEYNKGVVFKVGSEECTPHEHYDAAVAQIKEEFLRQHKNKKASIGDFTTCANMGMALDEEIISYYQRLAEESYRISIEYADKERVNKGNSYSEQLNKAALAVAKARGEQP